MHRGPAAILASFALATCAPSARAEPAPSGPDSRPAPPPEEASGIREAPERPTDWRWIPRSLLLLPRAAVALAFAPVRLVVWAYGRYDLENRFYRAFFNESGTVGLYPLVFYDSGLGVSAGGRFVHRDLGGRGGRLSLRVGFGGENEAVASAALSSGSLLGALFELDFATSFRIGDRSRFFGYGNGDVEDPPPEPASIDPLAEDTAVKTRYSHRDLAAELGASRLIGPSVSARLHLGYRRTDFDDDVDSRDVPITDVYAPASIPGFDTGLARVGGGVELVYDTRRPRYDFQSLAAPSTGWRFSGHADVQVGVGDIGGAYLRWGADAQRNIDLWRGDRVLVLRAALEALAGDLDDVPFVDLPTLGGSGQLRGYPGGRFRDRVAGLASAEYRYPISRNFIGLLAAEGGRVWRELSDVGASDLRASFGGGVQFHTDTSFIARFSVFTSIDGGAEVRLVLDPVVPKRVRRRD